MIQTTKVGAGFCVNSMFVGVKISQFPQHSCSRAVGPVRSARCTVGCSYVSLAILGTGSLVLSVDKTVSEFLPFEVVLMQAVFFA